MHIQYLGGCGVWVCFLLYCLVACVLPCASVQCCTYVYVCMYIHLRTHMVCLLLSALPKYQAPARMCLHGTIAHIAYYLSAYYLGTYLCACVPTYAQTHQYACTHVCIFMHKQLSMPSSCLSMHLCIYIHTYMSVYLVCLLLA